MTTLRNGRVEANANDADEHRRHFYYLRLLRRYAVIHLKI